MATWHQQGEKSTFAVVADGNLTSIRREKYFYSCHRWQPDINKERKVLLHLSLMAAWHQKGQLSLMATWYLSNVEMLIIRVSCLECVNDILSQDWNPFNYLDKHILRQIICDGGCRWDESPHPSCRQGSGVCCMVIHLFLVQFHLGISRIIGVPWLRIYPDFWVFPGFFPEWVGVAHY
jgi:hypothetical protein